MPSLGQINSDLCAPNIIDIYGEVGKEWILQLPSLLSACADKWQLDILQPFDDLSYNYVTPAIRADKTPVVLKAGVPSDEFSREIQSLLVFEGSGMVKILDCDREEGIMLLERLLPGKSLASIDNDELLTRAAVSVMQQLWTPAPLNHEFGSVNDWASGLSNIKRLFHGSYGPFPSDLVNLAQELFNEFQNPLEDNILIHGDFHPMNILSSNRAPWLAIDPKGVVGDPMYDVATFVSSLPQLPKENDQKKFLCRRIDQLTEELSLDGHHIAKWGLAQSVLSGWWRYEDHGSGWERAFERARLFESYQAK